jgi:hypothetical protein
MSFPACNTFSTTVMCILHLCTCIPYSVWWQWLTCHCPSLLVLCSNPTNYVVRNPKGGIAPKTCVDVIIRFQLKEDGRSMSADKFRIDIYKEVTLIGRKTISAVFQFIDSANLTAQKQSVISVLLFFYIITMYCHEFYYSLTEICRNRGQSYSNHRKRRTTS